MKFDDATEVEMLCYQMRMADWPRSLNRKRIDDLFNGMPPYSDEEVQENRININVNDLSSTRISHDARSQLYGAFLKPGKYFKLTTDAGPIHKRSSRSAVVTREMNRPMRRSLDYYECFRSKFATDVLHGTGIGAFEKPDEWCPSPIGIEDVMIPANTLLTMKNLPFFAVYRSLTAPELIKLTKREKVDPGWNMPLIKLALDWIDRETMALMGSNWPEVWSPEKASERVKGDGGFYVGDQVPTLDCWDFYFWNDDGKKSGWYRRMILDSWSTPQSMGGKVTSTRRTGDLYNGSLRGEFLYNPGNRMYAQKLSDIINFQFADLSAVAPFRYHSVRSLGYLLYAVCHMQNRLRCKFNEAVFEALMMYFRVKSMEDAQRALKVELVTRGFIDDTLQFVPAAERFQVNAALVKLGLDQNQQLIDQNSASYRQNTDYSRDAVEKTKFQVLTESTAMTALTSAALLQAYRYQAFEYEAIKRRFFKRNSTNPDVIEFQARCLKQDVPQSMMMSEAWDLEPEKVMGAGNKTLELAIAQQLMEYRNLYDPEPQRAILRDVTLAITDDPARAEQLVPEEQLKVSDSAHDAQLAAGTLMLGLPVAIKTGMNHIDYVDTLLASMAIIVGNVQQSGGVGTVEQLRGLQNMAQHILAHVNIIAQDQNEKDRVKQYGEQLGKLMNLVKGFAQRLAEQMRKQNGQAQIDPKDLAKIEGMKLQAQAKAANTRESHAQRTAQRQLAWEAKMKQEEQQHQLDMAKDAAALQRQNRLKSFEE